MSPFETCVDLREAIVNRETTAVEATRTCLDAIDAQDGPIHAFREVVRDVALERAEGIDHRLSRGEDVGRLAGVPIALKDNMVTRAGTTAACSRILENFRSPYDGSLWSRLEAEGAVLLGKTNMDEFAMGSSTEHSAFGRTGNPWDPRRVPGGSSGGSAAAVAAGFCAAAFGSDTGGSIRQPAAFCGVVGFKPTYGRVSRYGLIAFASSLDQIGPFTRDVRDAALLMDVISGLDPNDSTTADLPPTDLAKELDRGVEGLRIGVPENILSDNNDPDVNRVVREAIETYRSLGAEIVRADLELIDYGIATYYIINPAEASSNLARYDGIRYGYRAKLRPGETLFDLYARTRAEGFGREVKRRVMLGTYVLSAGYYDAYYKSALRVRRLIKRDYDAVFERCDVLLGPTTPTPAFLAAEKQDPISMYLCDQYTVGANIAGVPAMSLPGGFTEREGVILPLGIQLQTKAFDEATLVRAASAWQRATDHHRRRPAPVPTAAG